jgi:phosphoglycerol transferase MdoB-like AlkP superfamily enzyme
LLKIFLLFVALFACQKPVFLLYYFHYADNILYFWDFIQVIGVGFSLDASVAAFFTAIPALLLLLLFFIEKSSNNTKINNTLLPLIKKILSAYFIIVSLLISVVFISNIVLYRYWGFPIDATVFTYLKSPKEIFINVAWYCNLLGILAIFIWTALQYMAFYYLIIRKFPANTPKWIEFPILFLCTALLFIPLRGGVGVTTINVGKAYYSDKMFLNHAAINPLFNIMASSLNNSHFEGCYHYMEDEEVSDIFQNYMKHSKIHELNNLNEEYESLLNTKRPNIVFILLESFGAPVIESMGGTKGITPELNRLTQEGVFFDELYASSFRTDRGIVAALMGYPALPTMSLLKYPSKIEKMPSIPRSLLNAGYQASFLYGGDVDFANIKTLPCSQGITNITSISDFPFAYKKSKWGVPDAVTFDFLYKDIAYSDSQNSPFLKIFLTLSSHDPFDVPTKRFENPYQNSIFYADSCLGTFIRALKASSQWDDLLIVIVPDHNARYPQGIAHFSTECHHSFMLWLGGAVNKPMKIHKVCSQTDIAATLLKQLQLPHKDYLFSRDILSPYTPEMAFYSFPNGFGMVKPHSSLVYDHDANQIIVNEGDTIDLLRQGKAFLQYLYQDIIKK